MVRIIPFLFSFIWFMQLWPIDTSKEQAMILGIQESRDNFLYVILETKQERFLLPLRNDLPKKIIEYYGLEDSYE